VHQTPIAANAAPERLLSWPQVRPLAGDIGRTTAWRMERQGLFPKSVQISPGRRAWRESDILAWQAGRAANLEAA
jgi:predicted DNA-binding transcriptional regulator AlpA